MKKRRVANQKGVALAVALMALTIVIVLGWALGTLGVQNTAKVSHERQILSAFYAAEAGVSRELYSLKQNINLNAGYANLATVPTATDTLSTNASCQMGLVNNIFGTANKQNRVNLYGTAVTIPPVAAPRGWAYILSAGQSSDREKRVGIWVFGGTLGSAAVVSGGDISFGAADRVVGGIRANGNITTSANIQVSTAYGDGNVVACYKNPPDPMTGLYNPADKTNLTLGANMQVDASAYVRTSGTISDPARISGSTQIFQNDTAIDPLTGQMYTAHMTNDGSVTPPASGTGIPNPDMNALLPNGPNGPSLDPNIVYHNGKTTWNTRVDGPFNLDGKIHVFPDGITFSGNPSPLIGSGTIIVTNGKNANFNCKVPQAGTITMNILAVDGRNGFIGSPSNIYFDDAANIQGLVYAHGSISNKPGAPLDVTGSVISYVAGITNVNKKTFTHAPIPYLPGFDAWYAVNIRKASWSEEK